MAFNSIACKYLEKDGKHTKCRVYPSRMKMAPWCMSVDEAICKGELPPDCPYVPENYGFKGRYILDPIIEGAVINIFKDMIKPLIDDGRIKFRRT